jgi:nucleotide-binding universal stress UspA family protein
LEEGAVSRVVAAVDESPVTTAVLSMARELARVLGATVEAVEVVEPGAARATRPAPDAAEVGFTLLEGDPLSVLVDVLGAADVVAGVLGARDELGRPLPAGHLALALVDRIDIPVVVVPPECPPDVTLRRVLIAMEGAPRAPRVLRRAIEVVAATGLEMHVVHVEDEASIPMFSDQVQHETDAYVAEFLARHCRGAPDPRLHLRVGFPADEVLRAVDDLTPDLIAMGWPRRTAPEHGTVVREILGRVQVPLLLVATD